MLTPVNNSTAQKVEFKIDSTLRGLLYLRYTTSEFMFTRNSNN